MNTIRIKNSIYKFIGNFISFDILFTILYWKITKIHYLKHNRECKLCRSYFDLREEVECKEQFTKDEIIRNKGYNEKNKGFT